MIIKCDSFAVPAADAVHVTPCAAMMKVGNLSTTS